VSDVLVLCYHAVSPSWTAPLSVTPDLLEQQLTHLVRRGWRGARFSDAVLAPPAPRTLAVTFDDAFRSVIDLALPVLTCLGLPATVFAPTAYVSARERLNWSGVEHWQHTPHAHELEPMGWDDLGSLLEHGWEVGSHTRTHPHLTGLDDESLSMELELSRDECASRLGRPCDTVAYPYGDADQRVADGARRAGYRAGAALSSRLEKLGPHRWPRVGIYNRDTTWRFRLKVFRPLRELRGSRLWASGP
jgi:peptidoglycan/xylan/chitin deacetylase (PgdA/CDA1 family)